MKFLDWLKGILGAKKETPPVLTPLAPIIKNKLEMKKRARKAKKEMLAAPVEDKVEAVADVEPEKKEPEVAVEKEEKPKKEKKPKKPRKPKVEKPKEDASQLWANVTGTPEVVAEPDEVVWVSQDKPVEVPPVPEVAPDTEVVKDVVKKTRKRKKKEG